MHVYNTVLVRSLRKYQFNRCKSTVFALLTVRSSNGQHRLVPKLGFLHIRQPVVTAASTVVDLTDPFFPKTLKITAGIKQPTTAEHRYAVNKSKIFHNNIVHTRARIDSVFQLRTPYIMCDNRVNTHSKIAYLLRRLRVVFFVYHYTSRHHHNRLSTRRRKCFG